MNVTNVYEITGDYDISAYVKVANTADLNNLIEEIRTIPGVKQTEYPPGVEKTCRERHRPREAKPRWEL